MSREIYRYTFGPAVVSEEIESTLLLAILAAESLHGASQVRLDVAHAFDADRRVCVIDASTEVGRDLNRLFTGFAGQEFGEDAFEVRRVDLSPERVAMLARQASGNDDREAASDDCRQHVSA